ncbi:MAG: O-antigen ligase family protein [Rhodothermales bacterium]
MSSLLEKSSSRRSPLEISAVVLIALSFFAFLVFGGEKVVLMLNGLCFAFGLVLIAYKYHWVMLLLWGLSTQLMVEMVIWDYSNYVEPSISVGGGVDMLYGDPVLFAMLAAMAIKVFSGDYRAKNVLLRENVWWTIFMGWMVFELARSMMMFGIVSPIGEFRTYFREILIVPYVVIFARSRQDQWRVFQILLLMTLSFIVIGLFRGGYVHHFSFNAYAKWLYQHGSLALLWGTLAIFLMKQFGFWWRSNVLLAGLIGISMALTIIASHRSVWLAAIVSLFVLFMMGYFRMGMVMKLAFIAIVGTITLGLVYDDLNLFGYIGERMTALTAPSEDQTASWRYYLWMDALAQSKAHILEGKGLGNYFQLRSPTGSIVTAMLHNQYIQLLYQIGVIGLILYLMFALQTLVRLRRTYKETLDPFYKMTALLSFVVLIGASAYYVAYDFEPFTWLFVGMGLAVAQNHAEEKEAARLYYRAYYAQNRI